jgi:hypothetical protein
VSIQGFPNLWPEIVPNEERALLRLRLSWRRRPRVVVGAVQVFVQQEKMTYSVMSHIVAAFCVGIFANAADAFGLEPDNMERVKAMIAFLDGEDWRIDKATDVLGSLTRLAPSDTEAQNAGTSKGVGSRFY